MEYFLNLPFWKQSLIILFGFPFCVWLLYVTCRVSSYAIMKSVSDHKLDLMNKLFKSGVDTPIKPIKKGGQKDVC